MKNLGKTIDNLIKIDPEFEEKLTPIKNRWKKYPSKTMAYWKDLIKFLNSKPLMTHPKRNEIKYILSSKSRVVKHLNSFEPVSLEKNIIGVVPENIADTIRKHDRQTIDSAKLSVEANITRDAELVAKVLRKEMLLEINSKKIWLSLKDHFKLWNKPSNIAIKTKNNLLVLEEIKIPAQMPQQMMGNNPAIIKMDPESLKRFLSSLGMIPPFDGPIPPTEDID